MNTVVLLWTVELIWVGRFILRRFRRRSGKYQPSPYNNISHQIIHSKINIYFRPYIHELKSTTISVLSFSIGHGCLQPAATASHGTPSIHYHMSPIPQDHELKDAILFAYGWSFQKAGESRQNFSSISEVPTVRDVA